MGLPLANQTTVVCPDLGQSNHSLMASPLTNQSTALVILPPAHQPTSPCAWLWGDKGTQDVVSALKRALSLQQKHTPHLTDPQSLASWYSAGHRAGASSSHGDRDCNSLSFLCFFFFPLPS